MKRKPDIIYIIVNILCLAFLIVDIELKNYFTLLNASYLVYITNIGGPLIVCLLIVYRQSHHQKAALSTKIVIDSCSAVIFLVYNVLLFRHLPAFPPESVILLCLFVVPAAYNIYKKLHSKDSSSNK